VGQYFLMRSDYALQLHRVGMLGKNVRKCRQCGPNLTHEWTDESHPVETNFRNVAGTQNFSSFWLSGGGGLEVRFFEFVRRVHCPVRKAGMCSVVVLCHAVAFVIRMELFADVLHSFVITAPWK